MIPLRYWLYIGGVLVALFAANYAMDQAYDHGVNDARQIQQKADDLRLDLNNAEKERIENDAQKRIKASAAAADHARDTADGLRGQLDSIKRIASDASGSFAPGASARDAVLLLADLLRQCGERYTTMARFADAAHDAGRTCEQSYDSLKKENPR